MIRSNWGYDIHVDELPPLITVAQFNEITENQWAENEQKINLALSAASQAVRDYCNWHISPVLECTVELSADGGKTIQLPALSVEDIVRITEDGTELAEGTFEWKRNGSIRRACFRSWTDKWQGVKVDYRAGMTGDSILAQIVAQIAASSVAASWGVQSEQVGEVSISYNQTASGVSGGVSLLDRDYVMLDPYRLPSLW